MGDIKVLEGNEAVAYAVKLCRPDVISAYPITPMSSTWDYLYKFKADGAMNAEMVAPESEHSAMSILIGAAEAGGRTFTGSSSQGLFFMYEAYVSASTLRLPIVMGIATREPNSPQGVSAGDQDAIMAKEAGWIQIHVESCQEILDSLIMAYRLAEDPEILVPVNVCYIGFYLTYLSERVDIPEQEKVDRFLPPIKLSPRLDPRNPITGHNYTSERITTEYRYKHAAAMQRSKGKLDEIDREFHNIFNRSYGGQIEEYRCEDADIVLVTMGNCSGTGKYVVDQKRAEGQKIGLLKVRLFRPFPVEKVAHALESKKAIGVIDRNILFGWNCGSLFMEIKSALYGLKNPIPMVNFIDGLSGSDITVEHIVRSVDIISEIAEGEAHKQVYWLGLE